MSTSPHHLQAVLSSGQNPASSHPYATLAPYVPFPPPIMAPVTAAALLGVDNMPSSSYQTGPLRSSLTHVSIYDTPPAHLQNPSEVQQLHVPSPPLTLAMRPRSVLEPIPVVVSFNIGSTGSSMEDCNDITPNQTTPTHLPINNKVIELYYSPPHNH